MTSDGVCVCVCTCVCGVQTEFYTSTKRNSLPHKILPGFFALQLVNSTPDSHHERKNESPVDYKQLFAIKVLKG